MIDEFTEVSEKGFGQNIISSIKGVVVGLILFLSSATRERSTRGRVLFLTVAEAAWG